MFTKIKKQYHVLGLALFCSSILLGSANAGTWPKNNDPSLFVFKDETLETQLSALPLVGNVVDGGGHTPFSDTYWPDDDISIAVRYVDTKGNITPQKTRSDVVLNSPRPSLVELKSMSQDELNALSPTEKFDIANGNYDYPLTKRIIGSLSGKAHYAYGICHGWSPTSSNYPEPQATTVVNKDGIVIPFGSSDVKGLMAFYYAWEASEFRETRTANNKNEENWGFKKDSEGKSVYWQKYDDMVYFQYAQLGERCFSSPSACKDRTINPASLHLALANVVARYHRSFEIDANNGKDIWNYPILGFSSSISDEKKIKPSEDNQQAVKRVEVITDLFFADVTPPQHAPTNGTANPAKIPDGYDKLGLSLAKSPGAIDSRHLVYYLYVDAAGKVVGGDWKAGGLFASKDKRTNHIGFVWRTSRVPFLRDFKILNEIYKPIETSINSFAEKRNFTPSLKDDLYLPDGSFDLFTWK